MLRGWPLPLAMTALLVVPASAADQSVSATASNRFTARDVTIERGEKVTWTNQGGFHNVKFDDGSFERPASPSSPPWTVERTFDTPGVHRYHCELHGGPNGTGMAGTVRVLGEDGQVPEPAPRSPGFSLRTAARRPLARVLRGVRARARCSGGCAVRLRLVLDRRTARRLGFGARRTAIGSRGARLAAGAPARTVVVRPRRAARKRLARAKRRFAIRLEARAVADVAETRRRRIVVVP